MTQYPPPPPSVREPPAGQPPPSAPAAPLERREQNKVVAGVCAGVAYRLGIDPNIVRVVAVVLTIFGGAGVLLYAIGWLLMPQETTGTSLGERALRGGAPNGVTTVLLALALVVVSVAVGAAIIGDAGFALVVLLVALTVGAVLLTRRASNTPAYVGPPPGVRRCAQLRTATRVRPTARVRRCARLRRCTRLRPATDGGAGVHRDPALRRAAGANSPATPFGAGADHRLRRPRRDGHPRPGRRRRGICPGLGLPRDSSGSSSVSGWWSAPGSGAHAD